MQNYINEIAGICKLPFSEISNKFKIIQIGEGIVYVTNYIKVIDYGEYKVSLKVKNGILDIVGECLRLEHIDKNEIIITGKIYSSCMGCSYEK